MKTEDQLSDKVDKCSLFKNDLLSTNGHYSQRPRFQEMNIIVGIFTYSKQTLFFKSLVFNKRALL